MTNEEAIKELQSMCDHLHAHGICDKDSNMLTACKMAISALEQMPEVTSTMQTGQFDYVRQPYEDAISRILKRMWNCRGKHTTSIDKVAMEQIIRDELPPVTPQQKYGKWIPVSERLPTREEYIESNGLFIVSDGNRSYAEYFDIYDKRMFGEPTMEGFRVDRCVSAWMPLPEPYKCNNSEKYLNYADQDALMPAT